MVGMEHVDAIEESDFRRLALSNAVAETFYDMLFSGPFQITQICWPSIDFT